MEQVRLVTMVLPHTEQAEVEVTKEMEEQVQKDVRVLERVLPMVQESVEMMEGVRDEVATMLQQTRQKERKERMEKEKLLRDIEREMGLRVKGVVRIEN